MSAPSADRPPLRIGTKERESAVAALSAHLDAGRLDADEYGERYAQASLARVRPELEALFTDLPAPHPTFDATPQPSWVTADRPRRRHPARLIPAVFLLVPVIAIVVAATTGFWFLFFAIPLAFSIVGRATGHRHYRHPHRGWAR